MKPVNIMDKNALLFVIFLFSGGLKALSESHAQIIRNEVNVCEGDQAILPCGGSSNVKFRWKLSVSNGKRQRIPHNILKYTYSNSSLIVKNVQEADTKRLFYCRTQSTVHHFTETYIYNLKIVCKDIVAYIGSHISLHCNVDIPDDDIEKIEWRFRSKHHGKAKRLFISKLSSRRIIISGRNLTIKKVRAEDCGSFICLASRKKNFHLSKGRYFYNIVAKKAPVTTAKVHANTPMMYSTEKSTSSVLAATTVKTKAVTSGKKTTISRTTILPSFPIITTKKPLTQKTQLASLHDGTTTLPNTPPGLPKVSTRPGTSTKTYRPSTKLASMTNEPSKHSTFPATEHIDNGKFQLTMSPSQGGKTTSSPNDVESSNDNQKSDEATTVRSSSGISLPGIALVGPFVLGVLIVFMANE